MIRQVDGSVQCRRAQPNAVIVKNERTDDSDGNGGGGGGVGEVASFHYCCCED